jgi:hypothetical protein
MYAEPSRSTLLILQLPSTFFSTGLRNLSRRLIVVLPDARVLVCLPNFHHDLVKSHLDRKRGQS